MAMTNRLCKGPWLLLLIVVMFIIAWSNSIWAGGNKITRDPSNSSNIIESKWDDRMLPITWVLSEDGIPGSGIDNTTLVTELTAAFDSWEEIETSYIDFEYGGEVEMNLSGLGGPLGTGIDGYNLITFTDTEIYFPTGVLAYAITFSFTEDTIITDDNNDLDGDGIQDIENGTYPAGVVFDGDIAYNSSESWSVDGTDGSEDVQAVGLHEIGHIIGHSHTSIRDAVMWPFEAIDVSSGRTLKADDIAYAAYFYPAEPEYSETFGSISGQVVDGFSGDPVLGAHVYTVDPSTGESVVGAYTGDDGAYIIPGLAEGNYLVAIEPLDGDPVGLDPYRINEVIQYTFDTNFPEEYYDANEASVEADPTAGLQVAVTAGTETTDIDFVTNTVEVPGVNLILNEGYGLFTYPVEVPTDLKAFDILEALGDDADVNAIDRFVSETGTFERAQYYDGVASGVNFSIEPGEAYVVHMDNQEVITFSGSTDCPELDLKRGLNLAGIQCPPAGYTAYSLLQDIGESNEVEEILAFDSESGEYLSVSYDEAGDPVGDDFSVSNGEGYIIKMLAEKSGVVIPPVGSTYAPVISGVSPGRGAPGSIVIILGEGFSSEITENTVSFNGVGASIVYATSTSLTVTVPTNATTGPLLVEVSGQESNSIEFVVESLTLSEEDAKAGDLVTGQSVDGALSVDGERDRYTFTALEGSLVTVSAEAKVSGVPDLVLSLENPYGVQVASDDNSGDGTDPLINNYELQNTGTYTIVVSNVTGSGSGEYELNVTITTRTASPQVSILGGNYQSSVAGSVLPDPLSVFITGPTGAPVAGVPVTFVADGVDLTTASTVVQDTNQSGIVTVETTLPATSGVFTITVAAMDSTPATFTISATNTAVATITMENNEQTGAVGKALSQPLQVVLADANGLPVEGALVGFLVAAGGGSVSPSGAVTSDSNGISETSFTLGTSIDDSQIVAAFVPGASDPLLFEAIPTADEPSTIHSNSSNFSTMMLGTSRLNAFYVEVLDQYDNPVEGATIEYTVSDNSLYVYPGLGLESTYYDDFNTDEDGLNVAMLLVSSSTIPTIDEFGNKGDANLESSMYTVTATVEGTSLTQEFNIDVDMGPSMVTYSGRGASAMIGQPLDDQVQKKVFRYQREDTYEDSDGDDVDDDNGDFTDEDFEDLVQYGVEGAVIDLTVHREDGNTESNPTTVSPTSITTNEYGIASTTSITMGDVGGVSWVRGEIDSIYIEWTGADGEVLYSQTFTDQTNFAESTDIKAIPYIISATVSDLDDGVDFSTINVNLNGTSFFDGSQVITNFPDFPEKLELIVGGETLSATDDSIINDSEFSKVVINYYPAASKLSSTNTVTIDQATDKDGNQQETTTEMSFTYP